MSESLSYARMYVGQGWAPVALHPHQKRPIGDDWQHSRLTLNDLPANFSNGNNVGLLLGEPSNDLVDTDLDWSEAVMLAPEFLPATGRISGRQSRPQSHWWFIAVAETKKFIDPIAKDKKKAMIVELRSTGCQTAVAPSIHPDGDSYQWDVEDDIATVPGAVLVTAVARLAACCLLARYWTEGKRHELTLATAGMLLRAGWELQTAEHFIICAARAAGDDELLDRRSAVRTTLNALAEDKPATGIPTLKTLMSSDVVNSITRWLDLDVAEPDTISVTEPGVALTDFYAYMPMHCYLFAPNGEVWPASSVNSRIPAIATGGQKKNGDDAYELASAWLDRLRPVEQMTWAPGEPMLIPDRLISNGGWIDRIGCSTFNLYRPPNITHGDASRAGPWLDHIARVYPSDAEHIAAWLAHRVQHPAMKINHALVLGGAQGIGKDTILEPEKYAVGPWNFCDVSPAHLLGRFNGFIKSVILRLSEGHDLGDVDRYAFYEHLKVYTASPPDVLRCDEKNLREHAVLNCCGVVITTNHKTDGIYLPADDRRHYVAWSDLTKDDFADGYWTKLYRWYEREGYGHVAAYLDGLDISGFNPKAPPPKTEAFWAIVDANRAPEDAELADVLDGLGVPNAETKQIDLPDAVTLDDLADNASGDFRDWLRERKNRRQIPHRLESAGYVPVRNNAAKDGQWVVGGKRMTVYAKSSLSLRERIKVATEKAK